MILPPAYLKAKNFRIICCGSRFMNDFKRAELTSVSCTNNEVFSFIYCHKIWKKESWSENLAERESIIKDILE